MKMLKSIGVEPALFLYMLTSFIKFPVFQELLYDKACQQRYPNESAYCNNITAVHDDKNLQTDENHFYMLSSLSLLIPSIFVALILGSASDAWNTKIPMIIPLIGLILGDVNYIIQTANMQLSVYWLFISDLLFGIGGGYSAIIGTMIAYGMKQTAVENRGLRMAALEGSIGVGGTIGYATSGMLRQAIGYKNLFIALLGVHILALLYLICFTRNLNRDVNNDHDHDNDHDHHSSSSSSSSDSSPSQRPTIFRIIVNRFVDVIHVLSRKRAALQQRCLWLILIAFAVELLSFDGVMDIQYSFFRYVLKWGSKEFGWFNGMQYALSSGAVLLLYPLLRSHWKLPDSTLAIIAKSISLIVLAFVVNNWMAYSVNILLIFSRFVATGMRALCSKLVDHSEQGKIFSVIALIDGIIALIASSIFNGLLYHYTLDFFPGTCFVLIAILLIIPMVILRYIQRVSSIRIVTETEQDQDEENKAIGREETNRE